MTKIAFASRWGQPCGISTYCEQLATALHKAGHEIVVWGPALFGAASTNIRDVPGGIPVEYVWYNERDNAGTAANNISAFVQRVERDKPDVVHVQHEHGLWGNNDAFLQQLRAIREAGAKVVVTLHTVFLYGSPAHCSGFFDRLRHFADAIIVHTPQAYATMKLARGPATIALIPHGTPEEAAGDVASGYEFLGLKPSKGALGLVFGFIGQGKNLVCTIHTFVEGLIRRWIPASSTLAIVGEAPNSTYPQDLERVIDATGFGPCVKMVRQFVPTGTVRHLMAAADFAVLNTTAETLSASGAVHAHAAHGVPLAVANRPIYNDAIAHGAIPFDLDKRNVEKVTLSGVNAVSALARSEAVRSRVSAELMRLAEETRWSKLVTDFYEGFYEELVRR